MVLSCVLMFVDHHEKHLQGVRETLAALVTPIVFLADIPGEFFAWGGENLISRSQLRQENARLNDEVLILKAQLQTLVALQSENARLRNLLGTENKRVERKMVAEIIQVDSDPFSLKFMINKGSNHDVYIGQTVIDAYGIVGQVVEVSPFYSRVLMITDSSHAIPVKVNRNGVRTTAVGTGQINLLELQYVSDTTDIKVGDLLISSGLGQRFPDGYPVAKVISVEPDPGESFTRIFAVPEARLNQSSLVLLVWANQPVRE
ncbi:rod shape-determining protein MreC [Aliikangiella sp. GXAS 306]